MTIRISTTLPSADVLVVALFAKQRPQDHPWWPAFSPAVRAAIVAVLRQPKTPLEYQAVHPVPLLKGRWPNVLVVGLGDRGQWTDRRDRLVVRKVVRLAQDQHWPTMAFAMQRLTPAAAQSMAENLQIGNYNFRQFQAAPKGGWPTVKAVTLAVREPVTGLAAAIKTGSTIGDAVDLCRDLANTPGSHMTPSHLARDAKASLAGLPVDVKVFTKTDLQKMKMGAILGVASGSAEEPKLIVMHYRGGKPSDRPIAFVGKGVTFDSGGLNLKPTSGLEEMHLDMSGGAAVIAAIQAIAALRLPLNVVGIVPAVENMPSGSSFRPGDLLHSLSGKTIEIGNTDAEGRVILADALTYAQKEFKPKLLVDVATLTGAALVALGQHAIGLFTRPPKLEAASRDIGETSGDYAWPLPMWEEYESDIKGMFGDVSNAGKNRWGGAINGAMFLKQFVTMDDWIHLDIAPTMSSAEGQNLAKGATGTGVRWLVELARRWPLK